MWTVSVKAGQSELNEARVTNEQTKERTNTSRDLLKYIDMKIPVRPTDRSLELKQYCISFYVQTLTARREAACALMAEVDTHKELITFYCLVMSS